MNLTIDQIKVILGWADFCVETGDGFEEIESELYDLLNAWAEREAAEQK